MNKHRSTFRLLALLLSAVLMADCSSSGNRLADLDVTFLSNISNEPLFAWKIMAEDNGFSQDAYQLIVADKLSLIKKNKGNIWDSGQTNFEDYTYYSAYDIDPANLSGESVIGVMLGNGWYNQDVAGQVMPMP